MDAKHVWSAAKLEPKIKIKNLDKVLLSLQFVFIHYLAPNYYFLPHLAA
jgi:hypothetical protein